MTSTSAIAGMPDFAGLFPVCRCRRRSCEACSTWQVTPQMAAALWSAAQILADCAYDDAELHGDNPVDDTDWRWSVLDEYPPVTYRQDRTWRRQAARAYDDLSDDLESGMWPRPRCPAEEMALHLMLQRLEDWEGDGPDAFGVDWEELATLPTYRRLDRDWNAASTFLFQDHDILALYELASDGIEDPDSPENQATGIGDYRPAAWFDWFSNRIPRDRARGFRR